MEKSNSVISYITLGVSNLELMENFYSSFGFEVFNQSKNIEHPFVMYKSGSLVLALYPKHLLAKQATCNIAEFDTNRAMSLSLNVQSKRLVDEFLGKAKMLKAEVTRDGFEPQWGGYCGYFKDPENNLWEVVWHEKFNFPD